MFIAGGGCWRLIGEDIFTGDRSKVAIVLKYRFKFSEYRVSGEEMIPARYVRVLITPAFWVGCSLSMLGQPVSMAGFL